VDEVGYVEEAVEGLPANEELAVLLPLLLQGLEVALEPLGIQANLPCGMECEDGNSRCGAMRGRGRSIGRLGI
jgi:hypothetical protein